MSTVEKKAFRIAEISTGNREEALDLVQDAMIKLVKRYADKDMSAWRPLFYTILHNQIKDWYRKNKVRQLYQNLFTSVDGSEPVEISFMGTCVKTPEETLQLEQKINLIDQAIRSLPFRQQQCVLLRLVEEMDIKMTAGVMKCSESSVKTHYARAIMTLKSKLELIEI